MSCNISEFVYFSFSINGLSLCIYCVGIAFSFANLLYIVVPNLNAKKCPLISSGSVSNMKFIVFCISSFVVVGKSKIKLVLTLNPISFTSFITCFA